MFINGLIWTKNKYIYVETNYTCDIILTFISPDLILESVPTSRTGVLPVMFLSWRGPSWGRLSPRLEVSPSIILEAKSKRWSTMWIGNHLSNHMDSPKVELPSISLGKMCTCNKINKKKVEKVIRSSSKKLLLFWVLHQFLLELLMSSNIWA